MSNRDSSEEKNLEPSTSSPQLKSLKDGSKKRKRSSHESAVHPKKSKFKKIPENDVIDSEAGLNTAFSGMDSQLLADYVAQRTRMYECDLSSVELEDKFIRVNSITDTTTWDKPRILDNLPGFLEKFSGNITKLWSASKKNGAPHTIIIASSGLRAANIARTVRKYPSKEAKVAKLFAKHIKIKDAINFLKNNRTGIAIGTPQRIKDLIEQGALNIDRLERIIIDASHIDKKKRGILEMKETQVPLIVLLSHKELRDKYCVDNSGVKILFY
ncbi:Protein CMS1 [Golovinomyces cichoracearum]|uniref:Protein CMS1 n=1 Tax=Golovinomyces cichoracearum TaxID=62708 RepID=A0A420I9H7_9PEZI|nr:Protein CMS1 [Golovinomyces cichoracearum]